MSEQTLRHSGTLLAAFVLTMLAAVVVTLLLRPAVRHSLQPTPTGYRIDVNRADAATLCLLPGIGPGLADRLVNYRQRHGEFRRVADLAAVPDIGPKRVRRLRSLVVCGGIEGEAPSR